MAQTEANMLAEMGAAQIGTPMATKAIRLKRPVLFNCGCDSFPGREWFCSRHCPTCQVNGRCGAHSPVIGATLRHTNQQATIDECEAIVPSSAWDSDTQEHKDRGYLLQLLKERTSSGGSNG